MEYHCVTSNLSDDLSVVVVCSIAVLQIITTIAGTGVQGSSGDGGPATNAPLGCPYGVALDRTGHLLYIADAGNNQIRLVTIKTGIIMTIAGTGLAGSMGDNGPAINAQLFTPSGIAVDTFGSLYIADSGNNKIRFVSIHTGNITTFAGTGYKGSNGFGGGSTGDGGPAINAQFYDPEGINQHTLLISTLSF